MQIKNADTENDNFYQEIAMNGNDVLKATIERLIENADEAVEEAKVHCGDDYYSTRRLVYYEVLDTIKDDIIMGDLDPADYGLGMDLEKRYLQG